MVNHNFERKSIPIVFAITKELQLYEEEEASKDFIFFCNCEQYQYMLCHE